MNYPDLINGAFETLGGVSVWAHARSIRADKMVRGISPVATCFMTLWGVWNLFYYPMLEQWASFFGGIVIVVGNAVWLYYAIKYRNR
jgi:hypothetical protein